MGCFGGGNQAADKDLEKKNKEIEIQLAKDKQKYKSTYRLLLLGGYTSYYTTFTLFA